MLAKRRAVGGKSNARQRLIFAATSVFAPKCEFYLTKKRFKVIITAIITAAECGANAPESRGRAVRIRRNVHYRMCV